MVTIQGSVLVERNTLFSVSCVTRIRTDLSCMATSMQYILTYHIPCWSASKPNVFFLKSFEWSHYEILLDFFVLENEDCSQMCGQHNTWMQTQLHMHPSAA